MGLESGEFITDLVPNWPLPGDYRREGDDHFRLIKKVLRNTFPNLNGPVTATPEELNASSTATASQITELKKHVVPMRVIMGFSGTELQVPEGWALCDGRTVAGFGVVPDLRGRFLLGADTTHPAGSLGGTATAVTATAGVHNHVNTPVALTEAQMPSHAHRPWVNGGSGSGTGSTERFGNTQDVAIAGDGDSGSAKQYLLKNGANKQLVEATGGGQTHTHGMDTGGGHGHSVDITPPYYALAFIIKTSEYTEPV